VRRIAAICALCVAGVGAIIAGPGASSGTADDSSEVYALFHNAAGLVGGEDMKIAGVKAGVVKSVELRDDHLALVKLDVDRPFAPFHADARCEIRSQSLIGERFIQCDPGTEEAGTLEPADGEDTPTLPPEQTTAPIDLDLVFDVFRAPYRERLAILLNELGAGLSGRGEDLNAIIRSANPALADARRVLDTLNQQGTELEQGIDQTDRVLAKVAEDPSSIGHFIDKLAAVSDQFGAHNRALGESVAKLPPLLEQAEPALRELDAISVEGRPVLRNLRRASPSVSSLARQLSPFARAARPTLARLGDAAVKGRTSLDDSAPFLDSLRRTLTELGPITPTARDLVSSLVERGGTEGLLRFFYNAALATSRYDGISHIFPAHLVDGACGLYKANEPPVPGCNGTFSGSPSAQTAAAGTKSAGLKAVGPIDSAATPATPDTPPRSQAPGNAPSSQHTLPALPTLPSIPEMPPAAPQTPSSPNAITNLLNFLLGR
jgi:phospholipid/cholesterol/gamma-HCH transport system substrate-binding protein